MRAVAITIEGVLKKPLDVEAQDIGGALLYASLVENFRLVVLGSYDQAADEQFMFINGFTRYVRIVPLRVEDGRTEDERKTERLRRLRSEGFHFEFVVLPDVNLAQDLVMNGFPVLLYVHPYFSDSSRRSPQAWDELAERVDFTVRARAEQRAKEQVN